MSVIAIDQTDIGEVLNFSAWDHEDRVSVAVAVRLKDGRTFTYRMLFPVARAQGYADKLNHAVNTALRHAPRRAGHADPD